MKDLDFAKQELHTVSAAFECPALVVMSGLPGSGKTYFSRQLAKVIPLTLIESDQIRKILVPQPIYTGAENARVFRTAYTLAEELLRGGICVAFDATNLIRKNRKNLYKIAHATGAKLILIEIKAAQEVILNRLQQRADQSSANDYSDADITVYNRLSSTAQPILRDHLVVRTDDDITPFVASIAETISKWTGPPVKIPETDQKHSYHGR